MIRKFIMAAALLLYGGTASGQDGLGGVLPYAPPPSPKIADPIARAAAGLKAEVEDDLSGPDEPLDRVVTKGCTTELIGKTHRWTLNWRVIATVEPGDTFVFVEGKDVKLAIVGDAGKPDQARKLSMLVAAMKAMQERCKPK